MHRLNKILSYRFYIFFAFFSFASEMLAARYPDCKLLSSSEKQTVIEFKPQEWRVDMTLTAGQIFEQYHFLGSEIITEVGHPQMPSRTVVLGVPPDGSVSLTVLDAEFEVRHSATLLSVPKTVRAVDLTQFDYSHAEGSTSSQIVSISEPFFFRGQRLIKILFQPLQESSANQLRKFNRIVVQIDFSVGTTISSAAGQDAASENVYRNLVFNYQQARSWRKGASQRLLKTGHGDSEGDWYKIIIRGDGRGNMEGIYKLDFAALNRAGIPVATLDPRTIRILNNGGRKLPDDYTMARPDSLIENAITVSGEQDGRFDSGDYIFFYGRSLEGVQFNESEKKLHHYINQYGFENVYWLTFGGKAGKRMQQRNNLALEITPEPSFRDLVFLEEERNNIYKSGTEWFGFELANEKRTFTHTFVLPDVVLPDAAAFRFQMVAATAGYHNMRMSANGNSLGRMEIFGQGSAYIIRNSEFIAAGMLMNGANTITIQYESTSDITQAYVDWIEIEYNRQFHANDDQLIYNAPLREGNALFHIDGFTRDDIYAFDVTRFDDVAQIMNAQTSDKSIRFSDNMQADIPKRYVALTPATFRTVTEIKKDSPGGLRQPRSVDYIIITYDDFYQQAMKLESLREDYLVNDRLMTEVVKISDVYDEFSWGLTDPVAIRDFLIYAQNYWGNPRYVLLMGDGNFDYRNILKYGTPNLIPPYETGDRVETSTRAVDDWYAYTKGSSNGMQMAIGRLPVQTVDEAQSIVDKIIQYETQFEPGEWRKTVAIVGDDELGSGGRADVVDHTRQSEWLAEHYVPALMNVNKIYLMEYPAVRTASISGITKPLANEALLNRINEGCLVLNFIGHGNDELWTHERVLNAPTDFARIQNKGRYALWIAATCEFAYWDQPQKQSLAERLLNVADRGAVALIASSRLAYSGDNAAFNYSVFDHLFRDYEITGLTAHIGDAIMLAKSTSSSSQINNEKFILLGDPAMRLGAPKFRALVDQVYPADTLRALTRVSVQGHMAKSDQLWSNFQGKLIMRVFDARKQRQYITEEGIRVDYILPGNTLFRGYADGIAGQYQVRFIVPKDISYGGSDGRISLYGWSDKEESSGYLNKLIVGGTAINLVDHEGPNILIHFGNENFSDGDYTSQNPLLQVVITDSLSGVNIAGDIGHQIALMIDDEDAKNVTDYFQYDTGSYISGTLKYRLNNLSSGRHDIGIKAWDNSNNSDYVETYFTVVADTTLKIRNVLNYPNPMHSTTQFTYEISQDAQVSINIYSVAGRLIRKLPSVASLTGFNTYPEIWDGMDEDGDLLANGVYLYRIHAENSQGSEHVQASEVGKVIIMR